MRQKHNRLSRPQVIFSNGKWGTGFDADSFGGNVSVTQSLSFKLVKMTAGEKAITCSVTGSKSSADEGFRCGASLCSAEKIDITDVTRIRLRGMYSFTEGETYGDYHFRRLYFTLLNDSKCYVNAIGAYLSHDSSPSSTNAVPQVNISYATGTSGMFDMALDVSDLSGTYYLATLMLLKACSVKGTMNITGIWFE